MKRHLLVALLTVALIGFVQGRSIGAAAEPAGAAAAKAAADADALAAILGTSPALWQISPEPVVEQWMGRPVLTGAGRDLTLRGPAAYATDVQYDLTIALPTLSKATGILSFQVGFKTPEEAQPEAPGVYLAGTPDGQAISCYAYGGAKGYNSINTYYLKSMSERSLSWPEALRKTVESQTAGLPGLNEKWVHVRLVVRKDVVASYIDDRLISIRHEAGLPVLGHSRLQLNGTARLASFRVATLPPADPAFVEVPLGGFVNASRIDGQPVQRDSLPAAEKSFELGGVPFVLPATDPRGNDHVDIYPSLAQFGAMEGYFESYGPPSQFNGRWPTAMMVNPARIQVRVPNQGYNAIHILAAADERENTVPEFSAMFFKASSGYPEVFSTNVPLFTARASSATRLPVKLTNGHAGSLYLVTIPLEPGRLSGLAGSDIIELELTKGVQLYRSYPDPCCFSYHQAGLPSSVHVFALTLERPAVAVEFTPDKTGHVFTAPVVPSYTLTLRNHTAAPRAVAVTILTTSHDGLEKTHQEQKVTVPPGDAPLTVKLTLGDVKKYGYHGVQLTVKDGDRTWVEDRSLAHLHAQTRTIGGWEDGQGPLLGYYGWGGAHDTPNHLWEIEVMGAAGAETMLGSLGSKSMPQAEKDAAQQHGMITHKMFEAGEIYTTAFAFDQAKHYDPTHPEETGAWLVNELKKTEVAASPISKPEAVLFFPEPGIGPISFGSWPDYYGEPAYKLSAEEQKNFDMYLQKFLIGARAVRKQWPNAKILLPHGDPLFVVPFLRYSPEATALIDGTALDMPNFERLPESQAHQVVQHRLYQMVNEYKKVGKKPYLLVEEGTCVDTPPGALTYDEQAEDYTRLFLLYFAYGVYRHPSGPTPTDCANYWGEEHYGCCGLFTRLPEASPKPAYDAYATMSRHLNRANFIKWLPTGSLSAYCMQFRHYKTPEGGPVIHVLYTLRGKRPASLAVPTGAKISVFDGDDNETVLTGADGRVTLTLTSSPCYVEGLSADAKVTLGEPDNSDTKPAADAVKLSNLGDGKWKLVAQRDETYENNDALQIVRFLGDMSAKPVEVDAGHGGSSGKALAVHLNPQAVERKIMPWYTTLVPNKPITIPGKSSHLGIWVKAASDWGRVVYFLRDAKGQRWISIGTKDSWNCDDPHTWSYFNFDGWRYLRFEMPANAPYDGFREAGTTWWGHFDDPAAKDKAPGDGQVALPLALEKIIVERRTHAMYVNDPQPTKPDDVLLGELYAEYATPFDRTEDAVKVSRVRMAVPEGVPGLDNPIANMAKTGTMAATKITRIEPPAHEYDGTRCLVFFDKATLLFDKAGATETYSIWVSPYADGTGALELAKGWTEPGQMITGLRPDTDFYAFVVYADKDGKATSKPSAAFKIRLKDLFGMK